MNRFFWLLMLGLALFLSSCAATVTPSTVRASAPAYAGNAHSGIESFKTGGSYVTAEWVQNYNQAIEDYGQDSFFKHHLQKGEGVTLEPGGHYFATDEAHFNYALMQSWRRSGTHQPKTLLQKVGLP